MTRFTNTHFYIMTASALRAAAVKTSNNHSQTRKPILPLLYLMILVLPYWIMSFSLWFYKNVVFYFERVDFLFKLLLRIQDSENEYVSLFERSIEVTKSVRGKSWSYTKYQGDVILNKFHIFQISKKLRKYYLLQNNLKWNFGTY